MLIFSYFQGLSLKDMRNNYGKKLFGIMKGNANRFTFTLIKEDRSVLIIHSNYIHPTGRTNTFFRLNDVKRISYSTDEIVLLNRKGKDLTNVHELFKHSFCTIGLPCRIQLSKIKDIYIC